MDTTQALTAIQKDSLKGLQATPKYLLSKYFYDHKGSQIFQSIMQMPEYYLTRCEYQILAEQKLAIWQAMSANTSELQLIELGAGDGIKTRLLLQYMLKQQQPFTYYPVDISPQALHELTANLKQEMPGIPIRPLTGDYFDMLNQLPQEPHAKKVLLFLGANIGNFTPAEAINFLQSLRNGMQENDLLFIGFDLKKDPKIIRKAYDDPHGLTRDFNLNLLYRLNRELEANFNPDLFQHYANYNPVTGEVKSYLLSTQYQKVYLGTVNKTIEFHPWEPLFTEVSKKYHPSEIQALANKAGFNIVTHYTDDQEYFIDSLWQPNNK